jgi:hypothetical protein
MIILIVGRIMQCDVLFESKATHLIYSEAKGEYIRRRKALGIVKKFLSHISRRDKHGGDEDKISWISTKIHYGINNYDDDDEVIDDRL